MNLLSITTYFKKSFKRKKARRVFQEYGYKIDSFNLSKDGIVEFANWENPLVHPKTFIQEEIDFYKNFVRPGNTALDIGANVGDTTVPMAIASGKQGCILAFEPNPVIYTILVENASLNKDKTHIITIPLAASDQNGELEYTSSEASFSNGGIKNTNFSKKYRKYTFSQKIKAINTQEYLKEHYSKQITKLDLIKVDTEGFDLLILKNLYDIINEYKPNIIAEVFSGIKDEERIEMFDYLTGLGYKILNMGHFSSYDINSYQPIKNSNDMINNGINYNILAIPNAND